MDPEAVDAFFADYRRSVEVDIFLCLAQLSYLIDEAMQ